MKLATLSSKRALVTGATGFTGKYLCELLVSQGYSVCGIAHSNTQAMEGVELVCVDLLDRTQLDEVIARFQPTHVFHLAAIAFVAHGDPVEIYSVNVIGLEYLLDSIVSCCDQPPKVVLASSANVYGNPATSPVPESLLPAPVNHYGCSKLSGEHIAHTYFDKLPIVIVRPFNYTGPGQSEKFLVPKIVKHFRDRAPVIELGNTGIVRDFSDVRDIVRMYLALGESDATGETVNLCSGKGTSLMQIIEMLAEETGHQIEISVNQAFIRKTDIEELIGSRAHLDALIGPVEPINIRQTLSSMLSE